MSDPAPAPMKISLDKIDPPTQASASTVESAREPGKLPRRSMSLGGKEDSDALMKRPLTERRRAKTPPKGALPPLQSKGSMVKLEPLPPLVQKNIRFGSSSDLHATPPKSPSPEPTTSQDGHTPTATTTTAAPSSTPPALGSSSGTALSLNIGSKAPLPAIGNLSTSISEKSYFEESNIHPDVVVTVNFPNGQSKVMKLKIGETVQEIKRQLWVSHGIPFGDYTLHLQPSNKVMIDPLSLNDFPQIEAENKADIILQMKDGKEFKAYAGGADEVNANAQQASNSSKDSSPSPSSTPNNLQHIITDAHDNKHDEQHGAPLPGSTDPHHGEAHAAPSTTSAPEVKKESPKAASTAAAPSTLANDVDNNKPKPAPTSTSAASNGGETTKASDNHSGAKSGQPQAEPKKGGCCVVM